MTWLATKILVGAGRLAVLIGKPDDLPAYAFGAVPGAVQRDEGANAETPPGTAVLSIGYTERRAVRLDQHVGGERFFRRDRAACPCGGGFARADVDIHRRPRDPRHKGERPDLAEKTVTPDVLIQPHSAPLGITFYEGSQFPAEFRGDAFVALHGSWNRSKLAGYKIIRLRFSDGKPTGVYEDFVTGFVIDDSKVWGRPVDVTQAPDGALLFTEDGNGTLWRVSLCGEVRGGALEAHPSPAGGRRMRFPRDNPYRRFRRAIAAALIEFSFALCRRAHSAVAGFPHSRTSCFSHSGAGSLPQAFSRTELCQLSVIMPMPFAASHSCAEPSITRL